MEKPDMNVFSVLGQEKAFAEMFCFGECEASSPHAEESDRSHVTITAQISLYATVWSLLDVLNLMSQLAMP